MINRPIDQPINRKYAMQPARFYINRNEVLQKTDYKIRHKKTSAEQEC